MTTRRAIAVLIVGLGLIASSRPATALDCMKFSLKRMIRYHENVVVGEIVAHHPNTEKPGHYEVKILKVLSNKGLFKAKQQRFFLADSNGWDRFVYKRGQIVLFYFGKYLGIKCNIPIVLK